MTYKYYCDYIPITTPYNRRPGIKMEPTSITIHNTGNPSSTAKSERKWLTSSMNTLTASYHIVIDEQEAIEVLPLNEVAWHAGDGNKEETGNRTSIGIKICESGNYEQALKNSIELVAKMLYERKWGVNRLYRHFDWIGKNCPRLMNKDGKWNGWTEYINRVQVKLNELSLTTNPVPPTSTTPQPIAPPVKPVTAQQTQLEATNSDASKVESNKTDVTEGYKMTPADANKIIHFLSSVYNATSSVEEKKEFNRLANELRKASGQQTQ